MSCPRGCCATYREHLEGVRISTVIDAHRKDRRESRDMDAYKRLVQSGVQPKQIDGAHELERGAESRHEVEHASLYTDRKQRAKVTRAFEAAGPPDAA